MAEVTETNRDMTLIYTPGYRAANTGRGSPLRCSSPVSFRSVNRTDPSKDMDSTQVYSSSPHSRVLAERMKEIQISLSIEDLSSSIENIASAVASSSCCSHDNKQSRSQSCIIEQSKQFSKMVDNPPRSILKKSISADAASIAILKESLLESKCLSISLSDTNIAQSSSGDSYETPEEPKTPTKNVTFADDNNLSLCKVHNFVPSNEKLDQWQFNAFHQTHFKTDRLSGNQLMTPVKAKKVFRKPNELLLCFKEPCSNDDFEERFKYKCVALERCATRDRTLTGIILVKNIEFHKYVAVRYTVDRWKTTSEIEAYTLSLTLNGLVM